MDVEKLLVNYCSVVEQLRIKMKNYESRTRIPHNHINVLPVLMDLMGKNCKVYFEIGTYFGGSMLTSMQFQGKCDFYGLDFFGPGDNSEFVIDGTWHLNSNQSAQPGADITLYLVHNIINNLNNGQNFELIQGDSQSLKTIKLVNERFKNQVDILFIDGNHSFNAVCNDFNNYKDLVKSGGYIVFDDYGFLPDVRMAVDSIDKKEFDVMGRLPLVGGNDFVSELDQPLNASYIIQKK